MARPVLAGVISLLCWAFLTAVSAAPAGAADQPPNNGNLVRNLLSALRGQQSQPAPATTATTTPPTTAPPVTSAAATTPSASTLSSTLSVGSKGADVKTLEARLDTLHYFVGPIDETFDDQTAQAVTAFQKVHGNDRTGSVDQGLWNGISTAKDPAPLVSGGAAHRVEVDLSRQVLFLYEGGKLSKIIAVSTGNGEDYCENGSCGTAITPTGDFAIYRQGTGWETGPLGSLYNPQYFKGGYAIHGSRSVPAQPASHGCVRIPMGAADWFPNHVSNGTPVHIR